MNESIPPKEQGATRGDGPPLVNQAELGSPGNGKHNKEIPADGSDTPQTRSDVVQRKELLDSVPGLKPKDEPVTRDGITYQTYTLEAGAKIAEVRVHASTDRLYLLAVDPRGRVRAREEIHETNIDEAPNIIIGLIKQTRESGGFTADEPVLVSFHNADGGPHLPIVKFSMFAESDPVFDNSPAELKDFTLYRVASDIWDPVPPITEAYVPKELIDRREFADPGDSGPILVEYLPRWEDQPGEYHRIWREEKANSLLVNQS